MKRNPPWSREEVVLALDLYMQSRDVFLTPSDKRVVALSETLGKMNQGLGTETLRNPNGVSMKLLNFRSLDPVHQKRGAIGLKNVSQRDKAVCEEFEFDKELIGREATRIKAILQI